MAALLGARANDDHPAIVSESGVVTWREMVSASALRGAVALARRRPGPFHIGVLLPNIPEYLLWLGGAAFAGAAVVGINPTRRGDALAADVRATDCQLIVTDDEGAATLAGLDLGLGADRVLVVGSPEYLNLLERATSEQPGPADLVAATPDIDDDALYLLLFTSGTTGVPKAVRCTQGRLAAIAEVAGPGFGYTRDDVCYCPMPLFHGNALMALWAPAMSMGATVALRPRFSASAFLPDVRRYRATMFSYVGKAIAYILATPERPDDADNTLRSAFGTEASVRDRARSRSASAASSSRATARARGAPPSTRWGCRRARWVDPVRGSTWWWSTPRAGRVPPGPVRRAGAAAQPGEATGEIVNRSGPGNFEGYYGNPEAEHERTREGWYWTGDLAYRDGDGWFYFAGRRGDWLRVDSENFAAGPVEARPRRATRHPGGRRLRRPDAAVRRPGHGGSRAGPRPGVRPRRLRHLAGATTRPGHEVGAPVRAGVAVTPPDRHRQSDQGRPERQGWRCADPVFWRPGKSGPYRGLTDGDRADLDAQMAEHGRDGLLSR